MARVDQIKADDWPEELKSLLKPGELTDLEQGLMRYWAHRPDLVMGLAAFSGALKVNRTLPEKLVELVRLRVAFFQSVPLLHGHTLYRCCQRWADRRPGVFSGTS